MIYRILALPSLIIRGKSRRPITPFKGEETKRNLSHYRLRKESAIPDVVRILQNKLIDNAMLLDFTDSEVIGWSLSFVKATRAYRRQDNYNDEAYLKTIRQADEFIHNKVGGDRSQELVLIIRHCSECGKEISLEKNLCKDCESNAISRS